MGMKSKKEIIFSDKEKEVLTGCLLGDGHLSKPTGNTSQFTYCSSEKEHTLFVYKFLKKLMVNECIRGPKKYSSLDKRTKKIYTRYTIRTKSNISFFKLRQLWYPNGVKIIPQNIKITSITMLFWYLGDGGLQTGERSQYIKIGTDAFSIENINEIIPQLKKFSPIIYKIGEKKHPRLYIKRNKIEDFFNFIGPCPIKCYNHRWKFKEYKNEKYKYGNVMNFNDIKMKVFDDYKNGMSMWNIHKKYNIHYNLLKYHIRNTYEKTN